MARHWGPDAVVDVRCPARSAAPPAGAAHAGNDADTAEARPIIPAARRPPTADADTPRAATA